MSRRSPLKDPMPPVRPQYGEIRFEAQWISKQHADADGEWDPDSDEYATSHHATREEAAQAAVLASKTAGQCEWILVAEQKYIGYEWVDQRRWGRATGTAPLSKRSMSIRRVEYQPSWTLKVHNLTLLMAELRTDCASFSPHFSDRFSTEMLSLYYFKLALLLDLWHTKGQIGATNHT